MSIFSKAMGMMGYVKPVVGATSDPPSTWQTIGACGGGTNSTAVPVTTTTAMRASAVMACVKVLSETLAQIPLIVYRRTEGGGKERATDHPIYDLLHTNPNPQHTSFEWRRLLQGRTAYRGNAYCEIFWDGRFPGELKPLDSDSVRIESEDGEVIRYEYTNDNGRTRVIQPENMLHFTGLSSDGVVGLNPIQQAAQSIGISLSSDRFGGKFFANGARATGVLSHPGTLSKPAQDNLRESVTQRMEGENIYSPLILEEGMKWEQMSISPDEAQFLETRKFQVNDIARVFRVPPHMIGDLEKATFDNIEQQSLDFVIYNMMPWFVMWEQRLTKSLILNNDEDLFIEFLIDGLLRGDAKTRSEALQMQFMNGALSQDEWRSIENRNPIPSGAGDKFYRPLNLIEAGKEPVEKQAGSNQQMFESLLFDASGRIAGAEIRSKARNQFNKPKHESYVNKTLTPFGLKYSDNMLANGHTTIEEHKDRIFVILKEQRNEI